MRFSCVGGRVHAAYHTQLSWDVINDAQCRKEDRIRASLTGGRIRRYTFLLGVFTALQLIKTSTWLHVDPLKIFLNLFYSFFCVCVVYVVCVLCIHLP